MTPLALVPHSSKPHNRAPSATLRPVADLEVVIPALNEQHRIGPTLIALASYLETQPWSAAIVVIDNGCTDTTLDIVDTISSPTVPITAIGCSTPGKGAAVSRGMLTTGSRWVGFMDADLSTPVANIGPAVDLLDTGDQVVIGSRRCPGGNYLTEQTVGRRLGGAAFHAMARAITPTIADTQCGFKFFDATAARRLFAQARAEGFAFDVEIVSLAATAGIPVTELPVQWTDAEGSSFQPLTDGPAAVWELVAVNDRRQIERTRVARPPGAAEPPRRKGRRGELGRLATTVARTGLVARTRRERRPNGGASMSPGEASRSADDRATGSDSAVQGPAAMTPRRSSSVAKLPENSSSSRYHDRPPTPKRRA